MPQPRNFTKDPDAKLDWRFDWNLWLEDDEEIADVEILAEGVNVGSITNHGREVIVFLSGGEVGNAEATCRITTDKGREDDRTIRIRVRER